MNSLTILVRSRSTVSGDSCCVTAARFLAATARVQRNDSRLQELSRRLTAGARTEQQADGELTHWDRLFLAVYAQVAAGGSIKLVDARNGQVIFERSEVARSHEAGVPTGPLSRS